MLCIQPCLTPLSSWIPIALPPPIIGFLAPFDDHSRCFRRNKITHLRPSSTSCLMLENTANNSFSSINYCSFFIWNAKETFSLRKPIMCRKSRLPQWCLPKFLRNLSTNRYPIRDLDKQRTRRGSQRSTDFWYLAFYPLLALEISFDTGVGTPKSRAQLRTS